MDNLAEAMGLKKSVRYRDIRHQQRVSCGEEDAPELSYHFDPENDANDCDALIKHLNGLGWIVNVDWSTKHSVKIWRFRNPDTKEFVWQGDNWMHGVCELASRVLRDELKGG